MRRTLPSLIVLASLLIPACGRSTPSGPASQAPAPPPTAETFRRLSERIDPWVARPRVVVMTDIANEPDDQMSMVRLLVYSNEVEIEGLIASTSTWMRNRVRPEVINQVLHAYAGVYPTLSLHAAGFPDVKALRAVVTSGPEGFGMQAVHLLEDNISNGARQIVTAADRPDERPLWVLAWGGANTLAEALAYVRRTRPAPALETFVEKLRVYAISDQDDAGPWLRREFPTLHYIALPSTPDGDQYAQATWTGISGDRFYRNADGADFTTFTHDWVETNIRSKGRLGALYIPPCCIHEGDTPSFLGLINNGLASFMTPTYGGWGGRYVWRQYLRRAAAGVDAGRRRLSRPRQLARYGARYRRPAAHVGPGHDLAVAGRVPARLRRAHGLDDRERRRRESQSGRDRERPGDGRAGRDRHDRRRPRRPRRRRIHRP